MTLQEAIECGKSIDLSPRVTMLGAKDSIDDLPCDEITQLHIAYDYKGAMPDLSLFPNLISFVSTRPISMEYIAKQDFTKLKRLALWFEEGVEAICILAPELEILDINIQNHSGMQMNLFTPPENVIFIANMPKLKRLRFGHCVWHKVIVAGTMPSVEEVIFYDQAVTDFSILYNFPNIKTLVVSECSCTDVEFTKGLSTLEQLNVSYNCISDFTPLLDLPNLKEINVRRNPPNNASLLREKGYKVIMDDTDFNFEGFKRALKIATWYAWRFVERCRKYDPRRHPVSQRRIDKASDEELFLQDFTANVKREIETHDPSSEKSPYFPIPKEQMLNYVRETYPFVEL